jgi:WD40 repeat protein
VGVTTALSDPADAMFRERGQGAELGAWVVGIVPLADGAAFALADGTVHFIRAGQAPLSVTAHDGACLAVAPDIDGGVLSGGDDGRLVSIAPDGTLTEIFAARGKWIDHVAATGPGKGALRACAIGKTVHLLPVKGAPRKLDHPSTVGGIGFDAKGKRLAVAHYNGASLHWVASDGAPRVLPWKGSHTGVLVAPDASHVVTAMQENALHGWRLADSADMRMSGYPAKTHSLSFTANGKWLATSGAESVVLWPFFGGGPMGKAPKELLGGDQVLVTRVACHPQQEVVAAGFADGMVALAEIGSGRALPVAAPGRGAVSALAWGAEGGALAFGTETGFAGLVDLSRR